MDHDYEWLFSRPGETINVNMKNFRLRTNILQPIYRERGPVKSRLKYLRLDWQ